MADIFISWSNDCWTFEKEVKKTVSNESVSETKKYCVGAYVAEQLKKYLKRICDLKVYFSRDILSGKWDNKLMSAVKQCKFGIFIITEPAFDSLWVNYEYGALNTILSSDEHDSVNSDYSRIVAFRICKDSFDKGNSPLTDLNEQICLLDDSGIINLLKNLKYFFYRDREFDVTDKFEVWSETFAPRIKDVLNKINTTYTRTYKLRQQFSDLEKSKDEALEKLRSEKDEKINQLKSELKKYKAAKIDELQQQIDDLQAEISELEVSNSSLGAKYKLLIEEKQGLNNLLGIKDAKIQEFSGIIQRHEVDLRSLQSDKDDLLVKLNEKEQELERLQKQLEEDTPSEKQFCDDFSEDLVIPVKEGVSFVMKPVEGGTFKMGSEEYDSEKPIHSVSVGDFYIGETQVTQELWEAVMHKNPSHKDKGIGKDYPVNCVNWECIVNVFLPKLNKLTGRDFRLPTEAEWEYAARGGQYGMYYYNQYSGSNDIDEVAWYDNNSKGKTHPVKLKKSDSDYKKPNELGVYGMSGNVWEWCQDCWDGESNYDNTPTDGSANRSGAYRVLRGGRWNSDAINCRVSVASGAIPPIAIPSPACALPSVHLKNKRKETIEFLR